MSKLLGVLTMDSKGRAMFPKNLRRVLDLGEGDQVRVELVEGAIVLVPSELVPRDQLYFHTPEMRARVAEAEASFSDGTSRRTSGEDETQAYLDSLKAR